MVYPMYSILNGVGATVVPPTLKYILNDFIPFGVRGRSWSLSQLHIGKGVLHP